MYNKGVLGGTFDHVHSGHEALLRFSFTHCRHVVIGLTTSAMNLSKQWKETIQSYALRKKALMQFLETLGAHKRYTIVPIRTVYGTTLNDASFEVLFATEQTRQGAEEVNKMRVKRGLKPLAIEYCKMVNDVFDEHISSTNVRAGEIRRDGMRYISYLDKDLRVSSASLQKLKNPLDRIYTQPPNFSASTQIILIGDQVTQVWIKNKKRFSCAYVDMRSKRLPIHWTAPPPYTMESLSETNNPGSISASIVMDMQKRFQTAKDNTIVVIDGEEDLLVLPAMLLLPLQSVICYGHPYGKEGVVVVRVTEAAKNRVAALLTS